MNDEARMLNDQSMTRHQRADPSGSLLVTGQLPLRLVISLPACATSVCMSYMRWFGLLFMVAIQCSCTTLVNRRDLYSPEPGAESLQAARQWYRVTNTTTTITRVRRSDVEALPPPEFRY